MKQLLIATRSKGKFPEIASLLAGLPFALVSLADIAGIPREYEVEEPALTFEGNAIIKAMTLGRKSALLTLADDSGLEVDALGGRPGVRSARYAPGSDADRCRALLEELRGKPQSGRTARFRCVVAAYDPIREKVRTREGIMEGYIAEEPRGEGGFGYDPIFVSAELGKTTAELSMSEKNEVSHRGKAFRAMREVMVEEFV